jgi:hypothetical protein
MVTNELPLGLDKPLLFNAKALTNCILLPKIIAEMKDKLLPNSDFLEAFVADVETRVGDNLKVIADLASIEHPIETIINSEHFITEVLHEAYPAYWSSPEDEENLKKNGPRPRFSFKEWIDDFSELTLPERLREASTEVHEYTNGEVDVYHHEDTPIWELTNWLSEEHFLSFDHFNDRQVSCVALGQIYAVLDWLLRFAPNHSTAIDMYMVNIYHKLWFWISPWWNASDGRYNWFDENKDLSLDDRDQLLAKLPKKDQYKYISTLECTKRLGFGFTETTGPSEKKVTESLFEEARKKFEKRKPAHVDDKLLNELTDILESINEGAGIGVGCVATFLSGKSKPIKSTTKNEDGSFTHKYRNAKSDIAYKEIARACDISLVPTGRTPRTKKGKKEKGVIEKKHICHPKCQEFIELWPKPVGKDKEGGAISEHDWYEKPEKGKEIKRKYWFFHGRTNDRANGKDVAKWLIKTLSVEAVEKFVRQWNRIGK